ncbi:MAG TPA: hypothetical protein V6D18_15780 [Thermosynechococcaceae cyanobacterium]
MISLDDLTGLDMPGSTATTIVVMLKQYPEPRDWAAFILLGEAEQ